MRPILFLLCLLLATPSMAQRFSAGLRTGASHWFSLKTNTPEVVKSKNEFTWDQSGYLRYETKKRLAFEFDVAHYRFNPGSWWEQETFESGCAPWGPVPILLYQSDKTNTIEYTISAQYRITPAGSKIKSYFGANLSVATEYYKYSFTQFYTEINEVMSYTDKGVTHNAFCGFNNYTSIAVTPRLNINSQMSLKVNPFDAFSNFMPYHIGENSKFNWNIGCGYTF